MKIFTKRILTSILAFVMFLQVGISSFAINAVEVSPNQPNVLSEVSMNENGYMYLYSDSEKRAVIISNISGDYIKASISYTTGKIYEFELTDFLNSETNKSSIVYWENILSYIDSHISEGYLVDVNIDIENLNMNLLRSSAGEDLKNELKSFVGKQYSNVTKYAKQYNGANIKIVENLVHEISKVRRLSWKESISVTSFIVSLLDVNPTTTAIKAVCKAMGIAVDAYSTLYPDSCEIFLCRANYSRWAYVNDCRTPCNSTNKYIDYYGLDDGDPRSGNRAHIYTDSSDAVTHYSHNATYYNNYSQQVTDAYSYYVSYVQ